jgi:cell division protein FtsW (lipid II flippase)
MVKEVNKEHKNVKMTRKKKRSGIVYFDYSLLAILICLVCFGLVMLYSTSSYSAMMKQTVCFILKDNYYFALLVL